MMFKKALLEKVLSGEKTQTRRDIKRRRGVQVFSVGQIIGVRAGYTKYVGAVRIVRRRQESLGEISEEGTRVGKRGGDKNLYELTLIGKAVLRLDEKSVEEFLQKATNEQLLKFINLFS